MKPFNLEEALAGKPVVTRDGRKVTQFHLFKNINAGEKPLRAVIEGCVHSYEVNGIYLPLSPSRNDLFMVSQKVTKWVNVYETANGYEIGQTKVHDTEGAAETSRIEMNGHIATVPITFEI
jgi:hypothetical protein